MSIKETTNLIYDKKIRKYEKEVINFFLEYGKNKRSEMESHVLAYFLLREGHWLTQENIRELSIIFYENESKKGISQGSISKILNRYIEYQVLIKRKLDDKKNAFEYSTSGALNQVVSSTIELGVEEMEKYIFFLKIRLSSLKKLKYKNNEIELLRVNLIARVNELREFFIFHKALYEDIFKISNDKKINNPKEAELTNIQINKSLRDIEREIIEFIINCPILRFVKMKEAYFPIIAYFFTRKRLTQDQIKELTGISAGMVSEGLNYMLQEEHIKLMKLKGVRIRYYELSSIAYYNYHQLFKIFKLNSELYTKLDAINSELKANKAELKGINGFSNISKRVKQYLYTKPLIEKLFVSFQDAMEKYKEE